MTKVPFSVKVYKLTLVLAINFFSFTYISCSLSTHHIYSTQQSILIYIYTKYEHIRWRKKLCVLTVMAGEQACAVTALAGKCLQRPMMSKKSKINWRFWCYRVFLHSNWSNWLRLPIVVAKTSCNRADPKCTPCHRHAPHVQLTIMGSHACWDNMGAPIRNCVWVPWGLQ